MNYTNEQLNLWNNVANALRNEMQEVSFDTWVKPLELISVTSDTVIVLCGNQLSRMYLTSRYGKVLENAIKSNFGNGYSLKIVESAPDRTDQMTAGKNLLFDFVRKQNIAFTHSIHNAYRFAACFPTESRLHKCVIGLTKVESIERTQLHVVVELPIHIKRGEADHIIKELTVINDDLESNQCYDVDILEGTIRFRTIVDCPEDIEALNSIVNASVKIVEDDFIDIMQLVVRELAAIEKAGT